MSYLVLARKYRPQTFADVVQQQQVTQTLVNAITADRVAHAVLFTGPRGTGKTTIARILAKAMNCEKGPTPTPCNQCRSCQSITSGHATDVFEIDGASNNSVNEIRELRSNIKFLPAHSPYKIYIIDEVHMLSLAAFNALLKTLEEPPAHAMFLFATTEPHKIPATILSRCQRHDLSYIDLESIVAHLAALCDKEDCAIDAESLELIAREAGGSIRDALSLLDQVMSCSATTITYDMILDVLGVIDKDVLFGLSEAVFSKDIIQCLDLLEKAYRQGHDIKKLYSEILAHFRNLLVLKLGKDSPGLLTIPGHEVQRMKSQITDVSELYLNQILSLLLTEEETVRFSSQPRTAVEMAFIKLLHTQPALPLDDLIEKIEALKNQLLTLGSDTSAAKTDRPVNMPPETASRPPETLSSAHSPRPSGPDTAGVPQQTAAPEPHPDRARAEEDQPPATDKDAGQSSMEDKEDKIDVSQDPASVWERILAVIDETNPKLAANLMNSTLSKMGPQELAIDIYGSRINLDILTREKSMTELKQICATVLNVPGIDITINNHRPPEDTGKTVDSDGAPKKQAAPPANTISPLVKDALDIFDGEITANPSG